MQEESVAPKERVNITYRPATGDAKEEVELPLKMLIVGDFTLAKDDRSVEERDPINIDKDNFNDVLKAQNLAVDLSVANTLTDQPDEKMTLNLKFNSLKDFDPDAIVQQVPELKQMMELREAIKGMKGPLGNVPEFRKKIQSIIDDPALRDKILNEMGIGDKKGEA
ncbi:MAG TPA: type VI secretion system contractile sheath small subunit [Syntrophus sp. (in: bacteria)]|jgi:type VI secretion system protein ImpB|nr:type VI secretion system contractile sheath small subunit [Syntrophus sp. (in: bacteria)]